MGDAPAAKNIRSVMARFFLPKERIHDNRGTVVGDELVHLRKVLRLQPGDRFIVFDDTGWEHEAIVRSLSAQRGDIDILRSYRPARESALQITLAVGLTKGEKMDFVVEKATELGVLNIVPFTSSYTVPKLDDRKAQARTERWKKIAVSAAKQSGRTRLPKVGALCEFQELLGEASDDILKLFFWEKEGQQTLKQVHDSQPHARAVLLAIGPEGGFSAEEAELAHRHGFRLVPLGPRILRAETAAIVASSLVQFLWGDLD
jgi:16S rRNA (uracil1498-N3)-methyltransferase